jgi:alpha-amylase
MKKSCHMKNISLTFQVHQPVRLKRYRFFDIGNDNYYYDDFENERIIRKAADDYYLPTNEIMSDLLQKYRGNFNVAFSISGTALDLFALYSPEVIESFQRLSATGGVEFLGETYCHSFAALKDQKEFRRQVETHANKIMELFGQRPRVFKNTELIYSDTIGEMIAGMGFKAILTEGARHILKWRSPNHVYCNSISPTIKVLLKNPSLNEDITFRLSNPDWTGWPKTANNYLAMLNRIPSDEQILNLCIDYDAVGQGQKKGSAIFNFLESFPLAVSEKTEYGFMTPSEMVCNYQPVSEINVPNPISRSDKDDSLKDWLGNELQQEAFDKLYTSVDKINQCSDPEILKDWQYLQPSNHFYYMCSRFFSDNDIHHNLNPYDNPYEAFMNYMNVLSDFTIRLNNSTKLKKGYPPLIRRLKNKIAAVGSEHL